jgi:hypothetical protein
MKLLITAIMQFSTISDYFRVYTTEDEIFIILEQFDCHYRSGYDTGHKFVK